MTESYPDSLLVCTLKPVHEGEELLNMPLHVTIQPWFSVPDRYEGAFLNGLINYVHDQRPISVSGGEQAFFGPNKSVRVRKISHGIGQLAAVHEATGALIQRYDGYVDSEWVGDKYVPHVRDVQDESLGLGETVVLSAVQLLRRSPGDAKKIVEHVLHFGGNTR